MSNNNDNDVSGFFLNCHNKANNAVSKTISQIKQTGAIRKEDIITHNLILSLQKLVGAKHISHSKNEEVDGTDIIICCRNISNEKRPTFFLHVQSKNAISTNSPGTKLSADLAYKGSKRGFKKLLLLAKKNFKDNNKVKELEKLLSKKTFSQLESQYHFCSVFPNTLPLYIFYCFWNPKTASKETIQNHSILYAFSEHLFAAKTLHKKRSDLKNFWNLLNTFDGRTPDQLIFNNHGYIGNRAFENLFIALCKTRDRSRNFLKASYQLLLGNIKSPIYNLAPSSNRREKIPRPLAHKDIRKFEENSFFKSPKFIKKYPLNPTPKMFTTKNIWNELAPPLPFEIEPDDHRLKAFLALGVHVYTFDFGDAPDKP